MPPPPPPPPPGPPPPPTFNQANTTPPKLNRKEATDRGALLGQINCGIKLKPAKDKMVDKSGPALGGKKPPNAMGSGPRLQPPGPGGNRFNSWNSPKNTGSPFNTPGKACNGRDMHNNNVIKPSNHMKSPPNLWGGPIPPMKPPITPPGFYGKSSGPAGGGGGTVGRVGGAGGGGGGGGSAPAAPVGLGGLFAGGMPQLRRTGQLPAGSSPGGPVRPPSASSVPNSSSPPKKWPPVSTNSSSSNSSQQHNGPVSNSYGGGAPPPPPPQTNKPMFNPNSAQNGSSSSSSVSKITGQLNSNRTNQWSGSQNKPVMPHTGGGRAKPPDLPASSPMSRPLPSTPTPPSPGFKRQNGPPPPPPPSGKPPSISTSSGSSAPPPPIRRQSSSGGGRPLPPPPPPSMNGRPISGQAPPPPMRSGGQAPPPPPPQRTQPPPPPVRNTSAQRPPPPPSRSGAPPPPPPMRNSGGVPPPPPVRQPSYVESNNNTDFASQFRFASIHELPPPDAWSACGKTYPSKNPKNPANANRRDLPPPPPPHS